MTKIRIHSAGGWYELSVDGHTQSDVCTGISALTIAGINMLLVLEGRGKVKSHALTLSDGRIEARFESADEDPVELRTVLETLAEGFKDIREEYPGTIDLTLETSF